jgi:lipopolysaccharide transport system ATP-binding protein
LLEVGTGFHPELTGRENIFLNGSILGMSKFEIKNKFDEIVAFAEVEKFLDTPVKRYSSGMYVRLAFAVAAHMEPEILIVDEVLAVGDAQFQKKCLGKMEDVSQNEGRTVLFVSHNMAAINTLCKEGIFMNKGLIAYKGDIETCIENYYSQNETIEQEKIYFRSEDKSLPAFIAEAEISSGVAARKTSFDVHDSIVLKIKITCKEDLIGCTPIIDVKQNGMVLFKSFASDRNPELLDDFKAGNHLFFFSMPSPLKKGKYSIDLRIGKLRVGDIDCVENALIFSVDEIEENLQFKSYSSDRQGMIAVNALWQLETFK